MNIKGIALALAIVVLPAQSAWAWNKTTTGSVSVIEGWSDGSFYVTLVGSPNLCSGPTSASWDATYAQVAVAAGATSDGVKTLLSILMSAKLAGKTVTLYVNNNSSNPSGAPCVLGAVDVN
jgi:MFS superfamily sulfate permease-like transporter